MMNTSNNVTSKDTTIRPYNGLFITDLDGTLFRSDRTAAEKDLKTLEELGRNGIVRAVATGRSLYSFNKAVGTTLPVDYVIFSTGAGIIRYPDGLLLRDIHLDAETVEKTIKILKAASLDFMVQRPISENHQFAYWGPVSNNPDFTRRITLYKKFCWSLDGTSGGFGRATQLLAILPPSCGNAVLESLREELPDLNIVRATSPLDGESTWIEIFPREVSKSLAAQWLASYLGIGKENTFSIGNDYNDLDLLEWTGRSFVVENAPKDIKARFPSVSSNNHCGVTEAVGKWMASR